MRSAVRFAFLPVKRFAVSCFERKLTDLLVARLWASPQCRGASGMDRTGPLRTAFSPRQTADALPGPLRCRSCRTTHQVQYASREAALPFDSLDPSGVVSASWLAPSFPPDGCFRSRCLTGRVIDSAVARSARPALRETVPRLQACPCTETFQTTRSLSYQQLLPLRVRNENSNAKKSPDREKAA